VLYNILIEVGVPVKQVRLIKMLAGYVVTNCGYCGVFPVACVY
jgi:hypothetical protein